MTAWPHCFGRLGLLDAVPADKTVPRALNPNRSEPLVKCFVM
jgi:hypothetical protein